MYFSHNELLSSVYIVSSFEIVFKYINATINRQINNITGYIFKEGFSASTLHRMKHGKPITTKTLDSLCDILDCEISDVIERTVE